MTGPPIEFAVPMQYRQRSLLLQTPHPILNRGRGENSGLDTKIVKKYHFLPKYRSIVNKMR
ncbi:hypothetical protein BpHYR1_021024 [Brachionus plicatilis]|uniref:Uncharacterized protein n=1 Tax=Brachionus plicatilis TaxID=10195 RepID=A0A3M7RMC0_BRAPC|nr:hypothetical protein BpHYR1_021024 [Brachionus plicatilis]